MQAEYKINQEKNQIEIYFPGVPDKSIRDVIKENGYRWNRELSAWCNSHNDEALEIAKRVVSGEFNSTKSTSNGKSVPKEWSGHTFTEEEISQLEAGGKIRLTDCVSKRTGKTFSCSVTWDGTKINPQFDERGRGTGSSPKSKSVPKEWSGHTFTVEEISQLEAGGIIRLTDCVSKKTGKTFSCSVTWDGTKINPQFDDRESSSGRAPKSRGVPRQWSGHTFTGQEISQLEAGGIIRLTDCVSKRTGKTFSCSVTWDGTKINPQFDERESSAGSSRGVPKKWAGRMFSDSEMDQLGRGETIEVWGCVSKSGNDFDCFISWSEYGGISIEAFVTMDQDAIYDDWEGGGWLTHK